MNNAIQPGYVSGTSAARRTKKTDVQAAQTEAFLDMIVEGALSGSTALTDTLSASPLLPSISPLARAMGMAGSAERTAGAAGTAGSAEKAAGTAGTVGSAERAARAMGIAGGAERTAGAAGTAGSAERAADAAGTTGAAAAGAVNPEAAMKAKYPGLHYHVFDASSSYWRYRTDYPHYLLYQDGGEAKETLENWRPSGPNPFYGSIDGRFTAPPELRALGSVPPGSKAVVIHPKVQARMEQDPEYAQVILAKIDAWFAFDVARNEAILPGSTVGMSQAVAIGEDGNICNACASSAGGGITASRSGDDDLPSWWDLRMARHDKFMKRLIEQQLEQKQQASDLAAAAAAQARLAEMLQNGNLREIFGDAIAGIPTEDLLALTREQVWGSGI